jgi:hypothetical protein
MVPLAVPKAMVSTGTRASTAASAASASGRPWVVSPSDMITTRPGTTSSPSEGAAAIMSSPA